MAARVNKAAKTFIQYSKKMCTCVAVFWMIYRIINFVVVLIRPEIAAALTELTAGVDTIMITNMSTYLLNSSTEKVAIAFGKRKSLYSEESDETNQGEEEKDDNG